MERAQNAKAREEDFAPATDEAVDEALHALRVAIAVFDGKERLVFANRHFSYLFRSLPARDSLIGECYEDLIRREIAGGEIAKSEVLGGADLFIARRRGQLREGQYAPLDVRLSDGRIIEIKARRTKLGWVVLFADATSARHTLGRLEDAIALSADGFAFFDKRDLLLMCNAGYSELVGSCPPEELSRLPFAEIVQRALENGRIVIEGEPGRWAAERLEQHHAPAAAYTMLASSGEAYLVRDRGTRDGGRATVFTDVTDRHRTEKALAEQTETLKHTTHALARTEAEAKRQASYLADLARKLDEAQAAVAPAKTTLLRTMSHELKTPLNAIIGFADLLRSAGGHFTPEQVTEYASLIHAGGHNLLRLINQILDLTKIAAGRFELQKKKLDAGGALWNAKDLYDGRAATRRIEIDADACPNGLLIEADEAALDNMIAQLMDNAIASVPEDGRIVLSTVAKDGRVRLIIRDNGPGVAPEHLARILEPFEQLNGNSAHHSSGAGLGLTLTKNLVELHGGTLILESQPGEGFTAILDFPTA